MDAGVDRFLGDGHGASGALGSIPAGLAGIAGKDALIGETADALADKVVSLLEDQDLYERISVSARAFVEKNFSWETIVKKLENVYVSLLEGDRLKR